MFKASLTGNVGSVELKELGETSLLEFTVASTEKAGGKDYTTWITCKLWGTRGEKLAQYIEKGTALVLFGSIREESWEQDGAKRSKHVFNVQELDFQRGGDKKVARPADEDPFGDEEIPFN